MCLKLVEGALDDARAAFADLDTCVDALARVCGDDQGGWRQRRMRFNHTVRLLPTPAPCGRRSAASAVHEQVTRSRAPRATAAAANPRSSALTKHLANLAHGDLRRLHQVDTSSAPTSCSRARHEDDYNRVNVWLALIATIFLPHLRHGRLRDELRLLPLEHTTGLPRLLRVSVALVLVAVSGFWWRGWLRQPPPVAARRREAPRRKAERATGRDERAATRGPAALRRSRLAVSPPRSFVGCRRTERMTLTTSFSGSTMPQMSVAFRASIVKSPRARPAPRRACSRPSG